MYRRWDARRMTATRELNLLYTHSNSIGYGRLGLELHAGLTRAGVTVYDEMPGMGPYIAPEYETTSGLCKTVCWVSTPSHARQWWSNQRPALFTMWEATKLPPSFRQNMSNFETVMVPSAQNLDLFEQYHPNVRLVPLGIDPDRWHYRERPAVEENFVFLHAGSGPRKGIDIARDAFAAAFPEGSWGDGPVPQLVLKSPKGGVFEHSRVTVIAGKLSPAEEADLYGMAHVFLAPSRGEGFGLQPLQAIAQGIPTILTNAHGHEGFAHLGLGLSATMTQSEYFMYGDAGQWWEPDFDEMVDAMRATYRHYDKHRRAAEVASLEATTLWTWDATTRAFLGVLEPLGLIDDPGEAHRPEELTFLVRVRCKWRAEVGGKLYLFEPGVDYYEPGDIKRMAFEAEVLDPSCLEGLDVGLAPEQVKRLGLYQAENGHCPTCSQPLNSVPTYSDAMMAGGVL